MMLQARPFASSINGLMESKLTPGEGDEPSKNSLLLAISSDKVRHVHCACAWCGVSTCLCGHARCGLCMCVACACSHARSSIQPGLVRRHQLARVRRSSSLLTARARTPRGPHLGELGHPPFLPPFSSTLPRIPTVSPQLQPLSPPHLTSKPPSLPPSPTPLPPHTHTRLHNPCLTPPSPTPHPAPPTPSAHSRPPPPPPGDGRQRRCRDSTHGEHTTSIDETYTCPSRSRSPPSSRSRWWRARRSSTPSHNVLRHQLRGGPEDAQGPDALGASHLHDFEFEVTRRWCWPTCTSSTWRAPSLGAARERHLRAGLAHDRDGPATNNAVEAGNKLTVLYNRLRQAKITTELTEIVAGAESV